MSDIQQRIEEAGKNYRANLADAQYEIGMLREAITVISELDERLRVLEESKEKDREHIAYCRICYESINLKSECVGGV